MSAAGEVRVLLYLKAPDGDPDAVSTAYGKINAQLAGTPGLIGSELLRSTLEDGGFAVLSRWTDLDAFRDWEQGPAHRKETSPLRPYQDRGSGRRHYGIYEVTETS